MRKGVVYVISGPSGAGKGTVAKAMVEKIPNLRFSVSATNRKMREGEVDGTDYHFVSDEQFDELIKKEEFFEYVAKFKNRYGTLKSDVIDKIEKGIDVVLDIETVGAAKVKMLLPEAVTIFLLPPSLTELMNRLQKRGSETPETLELRLAEARAEIACSVKYDYVVLNDDLDACCKEVESIIENEKKRGRLSADLIDKILNS